MKKLISIFLIVLIAPTTSNADAIAKTERGKNAPPIQSHNERVCLLRGPLPNEYKYFEIGLIKSTKRTYGSTDELILPMANEARKAGADAIINLETKQAFKGPLPWRIISPNGVGMAIKLAADSPKIECAALGGTTS